MLNKVMIKILLPLIALVLTACVNKRGVSLEYNADCQEYYDLQGYYHKQCDDELITHKEMYEKTKSAGKKVFKTIKETGREAVELFTDLPDTEPEREKPQPNVW